MKNGKKSCTDLKITSVFYHDISIFTPPSPTELCEENDIGFQAAEELWQRSAEVLNRGITNFTRVGDVTNIALLHSNTGRLLRLCAFYCVPKEGVREFSKQERHYYDQVRFHIQNNVHVNEFVIHRVYTIC